MEFPSESKVAAFDLCGERKDVSVKTILLWGRRLRPRAYLYILSLKPNLSTPHLRSAALGRVFDRY